MIGKRKILKEIILPYLDDLENEIGKKSYYKTFKIFFDILKRNKNLKNTFIKNLI